MIYRWLRVLRDKLLDAFDTLVFVISQVEWDFVILYLLMAFMAAALVYVVYMSTLPPPSCAEGYVFSRRLGVCVAGYKP